MIKKITSIVLMLSMVLSFASCSIKKKTRTTLSNIIACINNYPINSHMIDGNLYIEVDNLSNYGFDVKNNDGKYEIKISEKEMKPKHSVKYYGEDELKQKGKVYKESTSTATLMETKNIKGYDVEGKFCIPFDTLKTIATGYEYREDVKKIIINKLKGMGKTNEYRYIKLRGKAFNVDDFFKLTFEDVKNALGTDFKEETEGDYTTVSYNKDVCPVKMYFAFSKDADEKTKDKKSVAKVFVNTDNVIMMDTNILGLSISEIEKITGNSITVYDEENPPYAIDRYYKRYNTKFNIDKDQKVLSYEVEKK